MSFQATPARSSRITKPRKTSAAAAMGLRRSVSSSSSASPRRKSSQTKATATTTSNFHDDDEKLDDSGLVASIAADLNLRDVPQYMEYILSKMFDDIPQKGAGMSATRIPEVLNFRRALPPIVTVAHIDALNTSHTATEREIAELSQAGVLRRVIIPHRGVGPSAIGDGIVSVQEWQKRVEVHPDLPPDLKEKYMSTLHANPRKTTIPNTLFTPQELAILTSAGFLTTSTTHSTSFASLSLSGPLSSLSTAGSRHAAGSLGAVGGSSASDFIPGGVMTTTTARQNALPTSYYNFSLPNTGSHIKLLIEARTHFLSLLKKTKFKEAPVDVLREQWDGGTLPGRTKKWRVFWGLRFDWVLGECVGAGLVEVFETGSVGRAVRLAS
ncbi:hypothetical protein DM02DRAFT_720998 [Periconia macrospinosa]|uniref:Serine-threonine protein kinase 19 n=1 Tax=Periconia macrospinosa TaxID=97972 RepID=A0A2V1DA49_9PLEO|nr:hypothetical protein DM02DRAFT_720998 [Periconia macrospinosa]